MNTIAVVIFIETDKKERAEEIWAIVDRSLQGLQVRMTMFDEQPGSDWLTAYVALDGNPHETVIEDALRTLKSNIGMLADGLSHTTILGPKHVD